LHFYNSSAVFWTCSKGQRKKLKTKKGTPRNVYIKPIHYLNGTFNIDNYVKMSLSMSSLALCLAVSIDCLSTQKYPQLDIKKSMSLLPKHEPNSDKMKNTQITLEKKYF
jgi:hypothetical protein